MRLVRLVRGFLRLGHRDQARLAAAWSLLGLSRLAILVLPFAAVRRALGEHRDPRATTVLPALDRPTIVRAARIGAAVQVAARHTPWRSECYPQALTARLLLLAAGVPHVVSFGVRRDGDALLAHAWVHAADVAVTGGSGREYTEVGSFIWVPRGRSAS